jgi:cysteine-rich repeat protein
VCGDGELDDGEACDLGEANDDNGACTTACVAATCGDGLVQTGVEDCDDQNVDNTDACLDTCTAASCGDGYVWAGQEECDAQEGCSDSCTLVEACTWDTDSLDFPITVFSGPAVLGEIAFDGDCDLVIHGGEETDFIYRVSRVDGSVTTIPMPNMTYMAGLTYRESDNLIYFFGNTYSEEDYLWALDDQDQVHQIMPLTKPITSLTVAPAGFGAFSDQLIGANFPSPQIVAIDVDAQTVTPFASSVGFLSSVRFDPDGTLYVAEYVTGRISTVTSGGTFTTLVPGLDRPNGMAMADDGTHLFVAHKLGGGRIDRVDLPGGLLTPGVATEVIFGASATGMVVDGADHVLYMQYDEPNDKAVLQLFAP